MAESKIINNAARILRTVHAGTPADQALRETLTQDRHFTAPLERRQISRAVFTYFRWWQWLEPKDSLQKQLEAALELQARFDKNESSVKAQALAARAVPEWLKAEMDPIPTEWLRQLQRDPILWIRVKKGTAAAVAKKLATTETTSHSPDALRYTGIKDLYRTPEFQAGEFEIQDLASQLVGLAAAPKPGEMWWDACAGQGGKTMHLSDLMENQGTLWTSDRSVRRLDKLKERASRAKVFNYRVAPWEGDATLPTKTKFDGVLVDAPCSGVGTWQRNPHARWTTLPKDVHELAAVQTKLLGHVADALKPRGRLVYAVCTLTRAETTAIAEAFTVAHPEFEPLPLSSLNSPHSSLFLWPHELNANGMFIAQWRRK